MYIPNVENCKVIIEVTAENVIEKILHCRSYLFCEFSGCGFRQRIDVCRR